jgi:TolB protein
VRRISGGGGDAVTPAWHPNGQLLAFSWTRGFAPGNYNVFVMDVASGKLVQLTHGAGRNEHPSWAPDGRHIVFESDRSGGKQIYTMLADGTQVRKLTSAGRNEAPVWSVR